MGGREELAINARKSVLSSTSPAKLNVIPMDHSRTKGWKPNGLSRSHSFGIHSGKEMSFNRPKLNLPAPTLIKRNSSFFKEDNVFGGNKKAEHGANFPSLLPGDLNDSGNSKNGHRSGFSFSQPTLAALSHSDNNDNDAVEDPYMFETDRFLPQVSSGSKKNVDPIGIEEEVPPPNASPTSQLNAQTKIVYKHTVARACGLKMNQRILQYVPKPPVSSFARKSYSIKKRTHYNYQNSVSSGISVNSDFYDRNGNDLIKLRKINTNPERILDAPGFIDDFYLNLLSWSSKNILAIALSNSLYLWNGVTGDVSLLVEYDSEIITSMVWSDDDCHISIGKDDGNTEIWDIESMSLVRTLRSNLGVRIGSQSWLDTLVATGSRSGEIQINDVRIKNHIVSTWEEHGGEVCGLSYKSDGSQLASGGNDNTVVIWDTRTSMPQFIKKSHIAAVKAISWCPYSSNLLATGGGQTDKHVYFWNTTTGAKVGSINTGSQVSSLHWGQSYPTSSSPASAVNREIVTTGGHPNNTISVFNYETKFKVAEIENAHESRICCSQLSPDGTTLATVGGDENLKFYRVFDTERKTKKSNKGIIDTEEILGLFKNTTTHSQITDVASQDHLRASNQPISNQKNSLSRKTFDYLIR